MIHCFYNPSVPLTLFFLNFFVACGAQHAGNNFVLSLSSERFLILCFLERVWCTVDHIVNDLTETFELDFEAGITSTEMKGVLEESAGFTFSMFEVRKLFGERSFLQNNASAQLTPGNYSVKCVCGGNK